MTETLIGLLLGLYILGALAMIVLGFMALSGNEDSRRLGARMILLSWLWPLLVIPYLILIALPRNLPRRW